MRTALAATTFKMLFYGSLLPLQESLKQASAAEPLHAAARASSCVNPTEVFSFSKSEKVRFYEKLHNSCFTTAVSGNG